MASYRTAPDHAETGWPKGIPYIIGNEGCERFSFYGMKAILFVYLTQLLTASGTAGALAEKEATDVVHTFVAGVYALPMVGALLADRLLGKYPTIVWLSLVYCVGHGCLALFDDDYGGFMTGLCLIAVGAGGIKPCVSAHVGDQFGKGNWDKVERVYQMFYFIINFGSFFSTLLIPLIKEKYGFAVAFGVPGVLMFMATIAFWMGRKVFVHVPPVPGGKWGALDFAAGLVMFMAIALPMFGSSLFETYKGLGYGQRTLASIACLIVGLLIAAYRQSREPDGGFLAVTSYALKVFAGGREQAPLPAELRASAEDSTIEQHWLWGPAARRFGALAAEGPPAVLRVISVFFFVSVFWALFDQHASSWIAQAKEMDRQILGYELLPEQISAANPALVMLLVPFMSYLGYPLLGKLFRTEMTPLKRMTIGMLIAGLSFAIVAVAQAKLDAGERVHIGWQLLAYLVLTTAEVMISITGLEFAYTQAPKRMKSLVMSFWQLTVSLGNILVALLARFENLPRVQFFWTFAGLMAAAGTLFGLRAIFYRYKTYTQ